MQNLNEVLNPDTADLIRDFIIVLFGFVIRFIEKKNMKKHG